MRKNLTQACGFLAIFTFSLLLHLPTKADVVILNSGTVITGNVLQQDSDGALIQMDYGTFRYASSSIKNVKKEAMASPIDSSSGHRIPNWAKVVSMLATNGWAHGLKQIPATVIDNGVLKDVPYISFRCNTAGYEINIYGDLDNPSGIEIGAINYLVKSDEAKNNCLNFICSLLASDDDKKIVRGLHLNQKDLTKKEATTFETTMPDESDAYGGWWVSVYDENLLATARASGEELLAITQPRVEPKPVVVVSQPTTTTPELTSWTTNDLSYSRPSSSPASSGDGRVYVRGYTRKDGKYVQPYTRSYPHRR